MHGSDIEREGIEHLERIEAELEEIKERTGGSWRAFLIGMLQGGGAIVGGVFAVAVVGWLLSVFGIIPGFGTISTHLKDALDHVHER